MKMKTQIERLTELLDTNCGYSDEVPAVDLANKLHDNGVVFTDHYIKTIVKHGQYAAAKWAGHKESRDYWEARYCGIQALYAELSGEADAYSRFNVKCGVTFESGHIAKADGTTIAE